jgi:hypothetical protein
MPDSFHYHRGEKCLETLKGELHEHPKSAIVLALGLVATAVIFKDELAGLFPSGKQLLSDLRPVNATTEFVDRSIPIDTVDRAALTKLLERSEVSGAAERGAGLETSNVVPITSGKRAYVVRTFGEYVKIRDLHGVPSSVVEKGHAFLGRMGKPLTVAETEEMSRGRALSVPAEPLFYHPSEALSGDLMKVEPKLKLVKSTPNDVGDFW